MVLKNGTMLLLKPPKNIQMELKSLENIKVYSWSKNPTQKVSCDYWHILIVTLYRCKGISVRPFRPLLISQSQAVVRDKEWGDRGAKDKLILNLLSIPSKY